MRKLRSKRTSEDLLSASTILYCMSSYVDRSTGPQFEKKLSIAIEIQIELDGSVSAYRIKESSGSKQFDLVVMTGMKAITFRDSPKNWENPPYIVTIKNSTLRKERDETLDVFDPNLLGSLSPTLAEDLF